MFVSSVMRLGLGPDYGLAEPPASNETLKHDQPRLRIYAYSPVSKWKWKLLHDDRDRGERRTMNRIHSDAWSVSFWQSQVGGVSE